MRSLFSKPVEVKGNDISTIILNLTARGENNIAKVSPGIAHRILTEINYHNQRQLKPVRKIKHLGRLNNGSWNPNFPISFTRLPEGGLTLVDGQHRLAAIAEHDIATPVKINIIDVTTEDEIGQLYAGFDEADSSRSEIEVIDGMGLTEKSGLPRTFLKYAMSSMTVILNDLIPAKGPQFNDLEARLLDNRVAEFEEWQDELQNWLSIYNACKASPIKTKLRGSGVMAVGLVTFKHQPRKAHDFWMGLSENDGLAKNDPRSALIRFFLNRSFSSGNTFQTVSAPATAWNAFVEGRDLKQIKCSDESSFYLWGTPFKKGNK